MCSHIRKVFCVLFLIAYLLEGSLQAQQLSPTRDSLHYEILMSSKMLDSIHFEGKFINNVDITSGRLVVLSTNDQFYVLGWGGIVAFGKKITGKIGSYAITPDGLLLAINNNELCAFDSLGRLSMLYKLPNEGMGINSGRNGMFIYDQESGHQINMLYVLAKGGKIAPLFSIATPIQSVVDMNDSILFATRNAICSFRFVDKKINPIIAVEEGDVIKSLTVDAAENRIYFSTRNKVFALKDSKTALITDKFGGTLLYFNDGLIVFNPEKKNLIRIVGLAGSIAP
jgi:hypothetical protein